jgi:hypothetical protein
MTHVYFNSAEVWKQTNSVEVRYQPYIFTVQKWTNIYFLQCEGVKLIIYFNSVEVC